MPAPQSKSFTVRKNALGILEARADIQLTAPAGIAEMLDSQGRLPAGLEAVRLADVALSVETGERAVTFGSKAGKVVFSAGGGPFGGLGAYRSHAAMLQDLALAATGDAKARIPLDQIPFPELEAARYCVLYAGFGAQASANGSVALGAAGAVTFGARGGRRKALAAIQAHAEEPKIHDAVRNLVESWRLPSQVSGPDDLPPGTWILAEVSGAIQARAGVQFGLDFNWVRSVKAKELQGDIGLKIQAGASAAFGIRMSDRYAVVVGRDSLDEADKKLHVRLHRLNERGWSVTASANLQLEGSTGKLTPKQMDDFIAAVLGVHGLQTLEDIRRIAVSKESLSEIAADFLDRYAMKQFGGPLEAKFTEVRVKALDWLAKWDALPSQAASALWDISRLDDKEIKEFVKKIELLAGGDEKTVKSELAALLSRSDFAATPLGLWFERIAPGRIAGALADLPQAKAVSEAARKTLDILNGGLLVELKDFVEKQVGLPPLRAAIAKNDFKTLNARLKTKLAEFLGQTKLDAKGIEQVRETLRALDSRAGDLYSAAVKALNETYRFTFDYAYRKSATKTALLDVTFDFGAAKVKPEELSALLQSTIAGDFRDVLPPPGENAPVGVSFRQAALTHHIQRSASVRITMPFFSSEKTHDRSSLASFELEAEDGGVYLYALDAKDEVRRKGKWRSSLSVGMKIAVGEGTAIRVHDREGLGARVEYSFRRRLPGLRTAQFERVLDVLGPAYFSRSLGGPHAPEKPSAHEWALALDKVVDGLEQPDDGLIGDSILRLDVSLPGEAVTRWLQAPAGDKDLLYMNISRRLQELLRKFIPFLYFQDAENYRTLGAAYPLLVYAALPVTTSIRVESGRVVELNTNRDVFWDWVSGSDMGDRRAMVRDPRTTIALAGQLAHAERVLASAGSEDLRKTSRRYAPSEVEAARKSVLDGHGEILFSHLLGNEADVIAGAVKAGVKLAQFREKADHPEKAIEALAEFGDRITRTFHEKLQTIFKPKEAADRELLRNLGLLVFAKVSETLPPSTPLPPSARLDLTVLRGGTMLAESDEAPEEAVSIRQALVEAGVAV